MSGFEILGFLMFALTLAVVFHVTREGPLE